MRPAGKGKRSENSCRADGFELQYLHFDREGLKHPSPSALRASGDDVYLPGALLRRRNYEPMLSMAKSWTTPEIMHFAEEASYSCCKELNDAANARLISPV